MNIAILGYDRQGKSAYHHWNLPDNQLTICDQNDQISVPDGCSAQLGDDYLGNLDQFDLLVRTPGLHPHKIATANPDAPDILDKVTTVTDEFLNVCPSRNIIGVTGTKGKGTTSTLIANMLLQAGKRVHLGGNIGLAPLDMLDGAGLINDKKSGSLHGDAIQGTDESRTESYITYGEGAMESVTQQSAPSASEVSGSAREQTGTMQSIQPDDWVVLELANFQLIDIRHSPHIAVCLMVVPEHLDWHTNIDEYLRAKQQLFAYQTEDDIAIYHPHNNRSRHLATTSLGTHLPYLKPPGAYIERDAIVIDGHTVCRVDEVALPGAHNLENICAAITAAWHATQDTSALQCVVTTFTGLPYRLQLVGTVDGVDFYNDSFGTTPETAQVAIAAMTQPTVLILGGSDKKADYSELATTIKDSPLITHVITIGETGPAIKTVLFKHGYTSVSESHNQTMADIVAAAYDYAEKPGAVLLSPACASFDMFANYMDRGDQFNQAVQALAPAAE